MQGDCLAASPRDAPPWREGGESMAMFHDSAVALTLCAIRTFKNDYLIFLVKDNIVLREQKRHPSGESHRRSIFMSVHFTALTQIFSILW